MIIHERKGRGLVNKIINKLPFELHIPGYSYCGPGTKLQARLARGDQPINPLDTACQEHDIAYSENKEVASRNAADRVLAAKAWQRVRSKDASFGEKAAAYAVTNIMNAKSKMGMGLKKQKGSKKRTKKGSKKGIKKTITFNSIVKASKTPAPGNSTRSIIAASLKAAKKAVKSAGGKRKIKIPRTLPVPSKIGGVLPLIPLFAGLSATGALAGGAASVYKAINEAKAARQQLDESKRHNKTLEAIALGKGLYLKPYKTGLGLHLKPYRGRGLKKKPESRAAQPGIIEH